MTDSKQPPAGNSARVLFSLLVLVVSLALIYGGVKLVALGGSSYYLIAGLAYLLLAVLFFLRKRIGISLSVAIFLATCVWAFYEVGQFSYWQLLPRLVVPAIILTLSLWVGATLPGLPLNTRRAANRSGVAVFLALIATLIAAFYPHGAISNPVAASDPAPAAEPSPAAQNWEFFGRNASGTRFAPYTQITPDNVNDLQVAWVYRTGRRTSGPGAGVDENTPLQIGNVLYSCTPENLITALDADTGKPLWKFDPHAKSEEHVTCRGVGYYDIDKDDSLSAEVKASYNDQQQCRQRILVSSVDARLFALDAQSGALCPSFGDNGYVDLKKGMGPTEHSKRYHPTSLPVVMGHLTVVGGWVRDIVAGEPSGAVRAFDVLTGKLAWAWDVGAPQNSDVTEADHQFALETPNV